MLRLCYLAWFYRFMRTKAEAVDRISTHLVVMLAVIRGLRTHTLVISTRQAVEHRYYFTSVISGIGLGDADFPHT